jgi:hypothetical protein
MANLIVDIEAAISNVRELVRATLPTSRQSPVLPNQQGFDLKGKVCGIGIAPDSDVPQALVRVSDEQTTSTSFVGLGQPISVVAPLMLAEGTPIQYDVGAGVSSGLDIIIPYHMRVDEVVASGSFPWIFYQPFCSLLLYMVPPAQVPLQRVDKSDQLLLTVTVVGTVPLWKLYVCERKRVDIIVAGPAGVDVTIRGIMYPSDSSPLGLSTDLVAATAIPASGRLVLSVNPSAVTEIDIMVANAVNPTVYRLGYRLSDNP